MSSIRIFKTLDYYCCYLAILWEENGEESLWMSPEKWGKCQTFMETFFGNDTKCDSCGNIFCSV